MYLLLHVHVHVHLYIGNYYDRVNESDTIEAVANNIHRKCEKGYLHLQCQCCGVNLAWLFQNTIQ